MIADKKHHKHQSHVEHIALNKVPAKNRLHWVNVTFIQAGIMICVPSLMLGSVLSEGLSLVQVIVSGIIGYAIVTFIFTLQAIEGQDLGVPTIVAASSVFGKEACRLAFSLLFLISLVGWFALQVNICGAAFASLVASMMGLNIPVWICTVFWGVFMFSIAAYGIEGLKFLNYIAIPTLILISLYDVYEAVNEVGITTIINYFPKEHLTIGNGIALTISFMAVGAVLAPDITRYQRNRKDTVKSTVFGIMPAGILMLIMGAVLAIAARNSDIIIVLSSFGIPILGMLILMFATWTANTANAYSAGLDYLMLFKMDDSKRGKATVIAGTIGTFIGAIGIIDYFVNFLDLLGCSFAPVAGIMIADYWIRQRGNSARWKVKEGYNIIAIISWGTGTLVSIIFNFGIPVINGFIIAMLMYLFLTYVKEECCFRKNCKG